MRSESQGPLEFALFDTALGRCGIAWSDRGVVRVQLPEADEQEVARRLRERGAVVEARPPSWVTEVIRRIVRHLEGGTENFAAVPLDMSGVPPFAKRVYLAARTIGPGRTASYGELALLAGAPGGARAAGRALGQNPFGLIVPCHRIVATDGHLGGFSAHGGLATKARMLSIEGVEVVGGAARARVALKEGSQQLLFRSRPADAVDQAPGRREKVGRARSEEREA